MCLSIRQGKKIAEKRKKRFSAKSDSGDIGHYTGYGGYIFAVCRKADIACGGIIYFCAVCRESERSEGFDVIADLNVGSIPYIISSADLCGKAFNDLPVVVPSEFICMSPEVKQRRCFAVRRYESVGQLVQARIVMMTGRGKTQPIAGDIKAAC